MSEQKAAEKPKEEKDKDKDKLVTVVVDGEGQQVEKGHYSTEELITLLGIEVGYLLNIVDEQGTFRQLAPGERVHIKEGVRFVSQVPGGGSS